MGLSQPSLRSFFAIVLMFAALTQAAAAQDVELTGKSFELTFVERQTLYGDAPPMAAKVPGISFGNFGNNSQDNRVALTFRTGRQVDYDSERNFGAIFQRDPKPDYKGRLHTQTGASGTVGEWFHVPSPYVDTNQMRVVTGPTGNPIIAELHGPNFMQVFEIVTDGVNCQAKISYHLDAGATRFRMFRIKTKKPEDLAALSADHIRCSLGIANIF